MDHRELRDALGCYATGVVIVTLADHPDHGVNAGMGITVNSFASVSLQPPLVLWSIDRNSDRFAAYVAAETFSISVLAAEQIELAQRFRRRAQADVPMALRAALDVPAPVLAGSLAWFSCQTEAQIDAGDHVILIGAVTAFGQMDRTPALTYFRGSFGSAEA